MSSNRPNNESSRPGTADSTVTVRPHQFEIVNPTDTNTPPPMYPEYFRTRRVGGIVTNSLGEDVWDPEAGSCSTPSAPSFNTLDGVPIRGRTDNGRRRNFSDGFDSRSDSTGDPASSPSIGSDRETGVFVR